MSDAARAEAERRYGRYRNSPRLAMSVGFVAGSEWQASRPFTEEDAQVALEAFWAADDIAGGAVSMRAALDAVTARHTKEGTP